MTKLSKLTWSKSWTIVRHNWFLRTISWKCCLENLNCGCGSSWIPWKRVLQEMHDCSLGQQNQCVCMTMHGHVGHWYGHNGATGGDGWLCWYSGQNLIVSSICWSIPCHQTNLHAKDFILAPSGCPSCSSARMCSCALEGISTQLYKIIHPSNLVVYSKHQHYCVE